MMKKESRRLICVLLSLALLAVTLVLPSGWLASAQERDYYVQYGGTGDGRSIGSPARSVKTAIASLNADGLGAGDIANIYVLESSGVTSSSHTLTPWGIAGDPEGTHTADIVIQGYNGRQWLAYGSGMNSNINLCGPTTFINLSLFTTRSDHGYIRAYGNNVTFGAGMKHYKLNGSNTQECYSPVVVMTRNTNSDSSYDVTATQTFTYSSPALAEGMFYIGSENFDNRRHKEDANIILNHADIGASGAYKLIIGGVHTNNSTHTFEKNLNIDVRNAAKIGFQGNVKTSALDKSGSKQKIKVLGGLQIITNPTTKYYNIGVADDISAYAAITGVNNIVDTAFWVLTVPSADRSKIDFTATAGTYSVSPLYTATATNNSTSAVVTSDNNNQLTVPAGDWTISFARKPATVDYYVQYGGTGDGRSIGSPARSVKTAIASLNADGLGAGDIANIYVLESSGVTSSSHTLTPWGIAGDPEETHTADIVIQGYNGRQWLAYGSGMNSNINLCGPTTFTNLSLFTTRSDHGYIRAYGNNVTFGAGMKHYKLNGSSTQECYAPVVVMTKSTNNDSANDVTSTQTFTYNSPALAEGMFYIGSENYDNRRHKEDANIILNHADIGSSGTYKLIIAGTNTNNSTHTFEKNLNIDVRNAAKIGFQGNVYTSALDKSSSNQKIKVLGGLQIITNPTTKFYRMGVSDPLTPYEAITGVDNIVDTAFWVLTVPAADRDKIDFTATAGTYSVANGYYAHATNNSTSEVIDSVNHQLTLSAGDWTITVDEIAPTYNYYVKNGGTGDGRTPGNPAPSVRYVSNTIYEDGLTANDTANIYIMQRDDVPAANSGTWTSGSAMLTTAYRSDSSMEDTGSKDHACKVIIQSYGESKNFLSYGCSVGQNRSYTALGPTEFKNIKLVDQRGGYGAIYGNGYSIQFDSDVDFYKTDSNNLVVAYAPNIVATAYTNNTNDTTAQQEIIYKTAGRADGDLYVASDNYDNKKHTEDMNIVFDNELIGYVNWFNVWFGGEHSGSATHTFQKNLNISVDNATKVRFRNSANGTQKIKVNGGLQLIANPGVTYYNPSNTAVSAYEAISAVTSITDTNIWALNVNAADREKITLTATAGTYNIAEGYTARATDANSVVYTSANGVLTVPAGDYTLSFQSNAADQYSDYIFNRGSGLQNTYSKLTTGNKTLNVLYYGGSVTEGYGTTDHTRRWRNLTTTWLTTNFPNATINPINKACGESGTFLGSYRMNRDILPQNPDLVFLEYSINDAYDNASYTRASYQFETIVRQIKQNFPTCDIITVLVTDYARSADARVGTLHTQAQAHEDISIAYNLPSLHVGCALASLLPENATEAQWKSICGALDTVHLKEAGNEVYYAVIEEYLQNELLEGGYNGTTAAYALPELQNDQLLDGNITYIAPSAALVTRSEQLGGYKVSYMSDSNFTVKGYTDLFKFKYSEEYEDAMLCIEFNGTELIGLLQNYNDGRNSTNTRQYSISVDGGAFTTKYCYHMNPTTFVTDLAPGDHVVRIKIPIADNDNWEWIGALFSRDQTMRTVKGADYTSEYVNSKFSVEGAEVRDTDSALRFVFNLNKNFLSGMAEVIEYGAIMLKTDDAMGIEMFLDTPIVKEWQWDSNNKSNFSAKTTGATPIKIAASNKLAETETLIKYTACLTGITSSDYDTFYTVRGYVKYRNGSNVVRVVYTDDFESSLYKVAAEIAENERTAAENAIITYVEGDRVTNYFATNTVKTVNVNDDANHKIVTLQDGLVVRDVTINSGVSGTEKTEIAFLTDPHLNYINEKDISTGNVNALASYRGREWLRDLSQMNNIKKAMKFASMFKKTVMGGDSVDYLSYGSLDMTKRLFTDKSVNGSIKMTMGNHEYMETCQPDTSGLTQQYSLEQRYAMVQNYWANNVYFDYEIMKKANGSDNLMLIYMDNAANKYRSSQLTQLTNALSEARSKNIPVLIFQHSPILTMNPNETSVYLWEGYAKVNGSYVLGNTRFATSENKTGTINMTSHSGYPGLGSSNSDTTTKAVCELIMQNYDIIKGVFHGHEHSNMYTEIVGHDSNGNPVSSVIPQYGGFGVHYNSVMKITVQ